MTLFTDSPYEKMMIQKPEDGKRDKSPPASFPPRCAGCPYRGGGSPLVSGTVLENIWKIASRFYYLLMV